MGFHRGRASADDQPPDGHEGREKGGDAMDTSRNDLLGEIAADAALERSDFLVQSTEQLRKFLNANRERISELGGLTLIDEDSDYLAIAPDLTVNYKATPNWGKVARQATSRGVDLVVEVGGVGTLNESIRATKIGGTIAFIGVLAGQPETPPRISLMVMQQQRLQGTTVGSIEDLQAMVNAITQNKMTPVMDKIFAFDEAKEAFAYMASGKHFGKVSIAIG